jgi:hypothetical protein
MPFPTYDVPTDFSAGCCCNQLDGEIADLGIASFDGIMLEGDSLTVIFTESLSQEDQDAVDAAIASHNPLASEKAAKHEAFDEETRIFLQSEYSAERQTSLLDLRLDAIDNGYTNRKAYIDQFRGWLYQVIGYHKGVIEPAIEAATTQAELDAVTWDLSQFDASKPSPRVEIHVAASMTD